MPCTPLHEPSRHRAGPSRCSGPVTAACDLWRWLAGPALLLAGIAALLARRPGPASRATIASVCGRGLAGSRRRYSCRIARHRGQSVSRGSVRSHVDPRPAGVGDGRRHENEGSPGPSGETNGGVTHWTYGVKRHSEGGR